MLLLAGWKGDYGLPIKGACAISGLFDLAPFPYAFLQPKPTRDQVSRNSRVLHAPDEAPPLLLVYGEDETDEFGWQSEDFLAARGAKGLTGDLLALPGRNYYDVLYGFLDAGSLLCSAILGLMRA